MAAVRHLEIHADDSAAQQHLHLLPTARACSPRNGRSETYRRRRIVVGVVLGLCSLAVLRVAAPLLGDPAAVPLEAGSVHIVQPGDTYWSIATSVDTDGDITGTVDSLSAANGGRALQVGDRLALPD